MNLLELSELLGVSQNLVICVFVILAVWEVVWKSIALWKSARNNHLGWFICIIVFNTVGILPIIYILTNRKGERA